MQWLPALRYYVSIRAFAREFGVICENVSEVSRLDWVADYITRIDLFLFIVMGNGQ